MVDISRSHSGRTHQFPDIEPTEVSCTNGHHTVASDFDSGSFCQTVNSAGKTARIICIGIAHEHIAVRGFNGSNLRLYRALQRLSSKRQRASNDQTGESEEFFHSHSRLRDLRISFFHRLSTYPMHSRQNNFANYAKCRRGNLM